MERRVRKLNIVLSTKVSEARNFILKKIDMKRWCHWTRSPVLNAMVASSSRNHVSHYGLEDMEEFSFIVHTLLLKLCLFLKKIEHLRFRCRSGFTLAIDLSKELLDQINSRKEKNGVHSVRRWYWHQCYFMFDFFFLFVRSVFLIVTLFFKGVLDLKIEELVEKVVDSFLEVRIGLTVGSQFNCEAEESSASLAICVDVGSDVVALSLSSGSISGSNVIESERRLGSLQGLSPRTKYISPKAFTVLLFRQRSTYQWVYRGHRSMAKRRGLLQFSAGLSFCAYSHRRDYRSSFSLTDQWNVAGIVID